MKNLITRTTIMILFLWSCGGKEKVKSTEVESLNEELKQPEEILLENEYIKAIEVELKAGEALPWHEGNERLIYPLDDFQVKFKSFGDDEGTEKLFQKDVPNWFQEKIHSVINTGEVTAHYLILMRKDKSFPEGEMYDVSELKEAEGLSQVVLFENPSIRVSRAKLEAGVETSVHKGIYRLVYPLTDYSVIYDKENQEEGIRNIYKGVAHWHLPSNHSIKNVSNQGVADFLVFEFRI
ncbi:hypothetical protein [Marivirga sp.]|uniref:hypothetical protein n=1 Tax=Marivirga sp. TaxID=2018662 RepID=UPI002D7E2B66|nr:hypothetical protein [Marivirga sp.]HET8858919.1 hypothetical protein [Marivirga sp.]